MLFLGKCRMGCVEFGPFAIWPHWDTGHSAPGALTAPAAVNCIGSWRQIAIVVTEKTKCQTFFKIYSTQFTYICQTIYLKYLLLLVHIHLSPFEEYTWIKDSLMCLQHLFHCQWLNLFSLTKQICAIDNFSKHILKKYKRSNIFWKIIWHVRVVTPSLATNCWHRTRAECPVLPRVGSFEQGFGLRSSVRSSFLIFL